MKRYLVLALVVTLLPLAIFSAQAADESGVFCGELKAADCQLLRDAAANMDALSSFAFDLRMTLAFDMLEESTRLSLGATGSIAMSPEAVAAAESMAEGATAGADMAAALDALIAGLSGAIDLSIALPEEETMSLSLLMKEGVIVLDMAALGELMGEGEAMEGSELFGLDANGIFAYLSADPAMAELMEMGETEAALEDATTIARLPDSEVNGVSVAVFESELGSSALVAEAGAELANMVGGAAYTGFESMTLVMREFIGLDDQRTHRVEATMAIAGDLGMSLELGLDMSEFNQPVAVALPEDLMAFPLAMMLQMMQAQSDG